jgi:amino acid transporter
VLPVKAVTGIGGFLDAVETVFGVYGSAKGALLDLMTLCFVGTLLTSGAVWMIGSDRILAVAAYDGAFAGFFGKFNARFGTPVRVNVMSGIVASIFTVLAIAAFKGGSDSKFVVVLTIAISTTLISYLWIFPAAVVLRRTHPHVTRPYVVPGGLWGLRAATAVITLWVALGSWVAVFPGTLERLFGLHYSFRSEWGVSQTTYETLTLSTLAVIVLFALIGYATGKEVREQVVDIPLNAKAPA